MKKRTKRSIAVGCLIPLALIAAVALAAWLGPPGPHFTCHRALDAAFEQWKIEARSPVWYPNAGGNSRKSLELVAPWIKDGMTELRDYRYVPGLKPDDPEELILIYMKEPSWRTWHGDTHWIRTSKRWVILNPRTTDAGDSCGRGWSELGEAITTPEFRKRLGRTLDFLRENNRPFWSNAVTEQTVFLNSIME